MSHWKKQHSIRLVKNIGTGQFCLVFSFVFCIFTFPFAFLLLRYVVSTKFQTLGIGTKALATSDFPLVLEKSYITAQYILYKTGRARGESQPGNPPMYVSHVFSVQAYPGLRSPLLSQQKSSSICSQYYCVKSMCKHLMCFEGFMLSW